MTRRQVSSGSRWEADYGYSRVLVEDDWLFVSGCSGTDYRTGEIVEGTAVQVHQTFRNLIAALEAAGGTLADVVQARYYIARRADVDEVLGIVGTYFADIRPAATAVIAELIDERMRIEIEVIAKRR